MIPKALIVPDAAVLRDDAKSCPTSMCRPNNQFARRTVTLGESQDGKTQILTGLAIPATMWSRDGSLFLQFQNSLQH